MFSWYAGAERYLIPVQLVLAMVGMGATLRPQDFAPVFQKPRTLAVGLTAQWLLVPVLALALIHVLAIPPGWAIGLLLVAVVPHGAFSNVITFVGRGNVPLSIALTAVTTLASLVTVPLALRALAAGQLPADFVLPTGRLLAEIGGYLLLPLVTGMAIRRAVPERADRISRLAVNASLVLVGIITVGALGSGRIRVVEYGLVPPLRIVAFAALIALCTALVSYLAGRRQADTMTLVVDMTIRNIGLGLVLVRFFFPGQPEQGHALYTCLFFAGLAPWLALPVALMHRAGWRVLRLGRRREAAGNAG